MENWLFFFKGHCVGLPREEQGQTDLKSAMNPEEEGGPYHPGVRGDSLGCREVRVSGLWLRRGWWPGQQLDLVIS